MEQEKGDCPVKHLRFPFQPMFGCLATSQNISRQAESLIAMVLKDFSSLE